MRLCENGPDREGAFPLRAPGLDSTQEEEATQ
jgi:hypothetical protein